MIFFSVSLLFNWHLSAEWNFLPFDLKRTYGYSINRVPFIFGKEHVFFYSLSRNPFASPGVECCTAQCCAYFEEHIFVDFVCSTEISYRFLSIWPAFFFFNIMPFFHLFHTLWPICNHSSNDPPRVGFLKVWTVDHACIKCVKTTICNLHKNLCDSLTTHSWEIWMERCHPVTGSAWIRTLMAGSPESQNLKNITIIIKIYWYVNDYNK